MVRAKAFVSLSVLVLLVVSARAADDKKDESRTLDDKALKGEWKPTSSKQNGNSEPKEESARYVVKFEDGGKYTITRDGDKMLKGTYKLDAEKKPAELDLTIEENADNASDTGGVLRGIIELSGEELKWCFVLPDESTRPTDFTAEQDSHRMLVVMKRDKKE